MADRSAPAFEVLSPPRQSVPVVLASPHSGRDYPAAFVAASRLDAAALRRSEDGFVDELFAGCVALGAPLVRARFPRAYVDPNREPCELDPAMFEGPLPAHANTASVRVRNGLGTIPRIVANGAEIYAGRLPVAEAERRIRDFYRPYHAALGRLIRRTRRCFGTAVLVDCHSMPSVGGSGLTSVDFVVGDRYGTSCHPRYSEAVAAALADLGYTVRRNAPYAGGFTTVFYGRPDRGVNALQIEVNRALYMDEARFAKTAGFARIARQMTAVVGALASLHPLGVAAE